jgi:osmoprotectant transport system ATP-binding protein
MTVDGPMIALEGVSKRLGGKLVLAPTTLAIAAKTTVALLGPSGCGKSTLLRLIVGLITPDVGTVRVTGEVVTAASAPSIRRRIGYVIQDGGLFPHLTAGDNAALMARHLGWEKERIRARLRDLAELVRLDPALLARFPEGYRHLAYVQTQIGYAVKDDMPGLTGPAVEALYARGAAWLAGVA